MNVPLVVAGVLAFVGAAVHGGVGQLLVVRRISPAILPSTALGGSGLTKAMIWVSWHMATIGLITVGFALVLSGAVLDGNTARVLGVIAASTASGFAALALTVAIGQVPKAVKARDLRAFFHPGLYALTAIAVLAWWGIA